MRLCLNEDRQVVKVAKEIRQYLEKHPQSADTLEGVANWWLLRHRYETALEIVQNALEYLIDVGMIERIEREGNRIIYRRVY